MPCRIFEKSRVIGIIIARSNIVGTPQIKHPIETVLPLRAFESCKAGLHNLRPAGRVQPSKILPSKWRKQFARFLQVPEQRQFQKFIYFGETNVQVVQVIWEHLFTVCEQTLCLINFNKNKKHSSLADGCREDVLKISCSASRVITLSL